MKTQITLKAPKNKWVVWYDQFGNGIYKPYISYNTRDEARKEGKDWRKYINRGNKHLGIPFQNIKIIRYKLVS